MVINETILMAIMISFILTLVGACTLAQVSLHVCVCVRTLECVSRQTACDFCFVSPIFAFLSLTLSLFLSIHSSCLVDHLRFLCVFFFSFSFYGTRCMRRRSIQNNSKKKKTMRLYKLAVCDVEYK